MSWASNGWLQGLRPPAQAPAAPAAPASANQPDRDKLLKSLEDRVNLALAQSWEVPPCAPSLSESELQFLRQHKVTELRVGSAKDPALQFVMGVIQSTLVQVGGLIVQSAFSPEETPKAATQEEPVEKKEDIPSAEDDKVPDKKSSPSRRDPVEKAAEAADSDAKTREEPSHKDLAKEVPGSKKDPAVGGMKKSALAHAEKRAQTVVTKIIKEAGASCSEGNKAFARHAGKVIGSAAGTAQFLAKVEEVGVAGATAETAKSVAISFVANYSAKALAAAVGCTNPVWCSVVVSTVIKDLFITGDTAGPDMDMIHPLPPPFLQPLPPQPSPVHLDPVGPSVKP